MKNNIIQTFKIFFVAIILSLGVSYVYAWTTPTTAPPAGNTPAPVNVGSVAQDKSGVFRADGLRSFSDLIVDGNITFGGVTMSTWPVQSSVPSGAIMMFNGVCPSNGGWSEDVALRGRVPRGEPNGNGASLVQGGSDNAIIVAHSHPFTTSTNGAHIHGILRGSPGLYYGPFGVAAGGNARYSINTKSAGAHHHTGTTDVVGSSGVGANVPRYQEVIFCLKS